MRAVRNAEDAFLERIEAWSAENPEYLVCRTSQHRWPAEMPPFRVVDSRVEEHEYTHRGETKYAKRVLVCDRCGAVRHDYYAMTSRRGHTILRKLDARYDLPPGYATKGIGNVPDARGLILGQQLEQVLNETPVPTRGRPRKEG